MAISEFDTEVEAPFQRMWVGVPAPYQTYLRKQHSKVF